MSSLALDLTNEFENSKVIRKMSCVDNALDTLLVTTHVYRAKFAAYNTQIAARKKRILYAVKRSDQSHEQRWLEVRTHYLCLLSAPC